MIYFASGKLLWRVKKAGHKGTHEIVLDQSDLFWK